MVSIDLWASSIICLNTMERDTINGFSIITTSPVSHENRVTSCG